MQIKKCDTEKKYVFISYSSRDKEVVWKDVEEFQRRGYNVWLDEVNLDKTKESWKQDAIEAIKDLCCKLVVFYVSKNSLMSAPCFNEMLATTDKYAQMYHGGNSVPFIAVDAESVGNLIDFREKTTEQITNNAEISKEQKKEQIKTLYEFIEKFFNSNNERVRIKNIQEENRFHDYYDEIVSYFPEDTKIFEEESAVECEAEQQTEEVVLQPQEDSRPPVMLQEDTAVEGETDQEDRKKAFSVTGDITYTLYGKQYTENQSDMMLRVFAQTLKRHEDVVPTLADCAGMNCVSKTDYTKQENRTDSMPSYFRVCRNFEYVTGSVCVGTAYSFSDKCKKIARLFEICGVERSVIESEQFELPQLKKRMGDTTGSAKEKGGNTSVIEYTVYGKSYSSSQTDMIGTVCRIILEKHPECLEAAAEQTLAVALTDYSLVQKNERPVYFGSMNVYEIHGKTVSVGGTFSKEGKLSEIGKLLQICEEDESAVTVEGQKIALKSGSARGRKKEAKSADDFLN